MVCEENDRLLRSGGTVIVLSASFLSYNYVKLNRCFAIGRCGVHDLHMSNITTAISRYWT